MDCFIMILDKFAQLPIKNICLLFVEPCKQSLMTFSPPLIFVLVDHSFELSAYKTSRVSFGGLLASNR